MTLDCPDVLAGFSTSSRQTSDGVKGYKPVTFRPSLPRLSSDTVKHAASQQADSLRFSSDSAVNEPTANGINSGIYYC